MINPAALQELGRNIAMHVVASRPRYLGFHEFMQSNKDAMELPEHLEDKPMEVKVKILNGLLRKAREESVLLDQRYCQDESKSIDQLIKDVRRDEMMEIELVKFKHIEIGD